MKMNCLFLKGQQQQTNYKSLRIRQASTSLPTLTLNPTTNSITRIELKSKRRSSMSALNSSMKVGATLREIRLHRKSNGRILVVRINSLLSRNSLQRMSMIMMRMMIIRTIKWINMKEKANQREISMRMKMIGLSSP